MSIYVEFMGLSGAGKTTLVDTLCTRLKEQDVSVVSKDTFFVKPKRGLSKLWWTVTHLHYLDRETFRSLLMLGKTRRLGFRRLLASIHEHTKLWHQLAYRSQYKVILWDGIFIQRFVHLVLDGVFDVQKTFDFIVSRLPKETLVVYIDVPLDTALERRHEREPRLDSVSEVKKEKEMKFLTETQQVLQEACTELEKRNVQVVRIDGTKTPEENADILVNEITERL
ncbi:AAA family ATPase [Candidatus Kaiserbacteria bacterium]|nr:AAA family ATPase [Candidatus Kaiserbacteria bacterium]